MFDHKENERKKLLYSDVVSGSGKLSHCVSGYPCTCVGNIYNSNSYSDGKVAVKSLG